MGISNGFHDILSNYPDAQLLKKGGQKAVYLITHPKYQKCVIKIGTYNDQNQLERINREVDILRQINSDYYPKNFDFIILPNNTFYIIEEYVDCIPLSQCIDEYTNPEKTIILLKELVLGLKILWEKNIVHRDMKPDNILILNNTKPKIIDLGIARLLKEESLTQTLAIFGPATLNYAAPEQLRNRKTKIDIRTDQFNLGIISLQLLLGGIHPFEPKLVGEGIHIVDNILNNRWFRQKLTEPLISPLSKLITKLLGNEPYMRFRNCDLLLEEISGCLRSIKQ